MPLRKPEEPAAKLEAGDRIRVRQTVRIGLESWPLEVTGIVLDVKPQPTGIHTQRVPADDLWVESILLEKADGEETRVTIDENTTIQMLERHPGADG